MGRCYRYTPAASVKPNDYICNFRLLSSKYLSMMSERFPIMLRFEIPDGMKLTHGRNDSYSIANDSRRIVDINYDVIVLINGKWVIKNELKPNRPDQLIAINYDEVLERKLGLRRTSLCYGYVSESYYNKFNSR